MQVRPVTRHDSEAWLTMRCELWPGDASEHRESIDRFFGGDRREPAETLLVLDDQDTPLGFAELSIRNIVDGCATGNVGYVEGWYVVPSARRLGVGRLLMTAAEHWARQQGCTEFASDVSVDNDGSLAAHRALGFEETGRVCTFRKILD